MIHWLIHVVALFVLGIGTIHDVKYREVPDMLNYATIGIGILIGVLFSILEANWFILLYHILGGVAGYLLGALMYYSGQWGGGDAKMLIGLGTLLGFSIPILDIPIIITLFVGILFGGAVYGILYTTGIALYHWNKFTHAYKKVRTQYATIRVIGIILAVLLLVLALVVPSYMKIGFVGIALLAFIATQLVLIGKATEQSAMYTTVNVNKLVPGDWIRQSITHKGKVIVPQRKIGLTQEDIELLKKNHISSVPVKEGIPFLPAFVLGYLSIVLFGNWLVHLVALVF